MSRVCVCVCVCGDTLSYYWSFALIAEELTKQREQERREHKWREVKRREVKKNDKTNAKYNPYYF